MAIRQVPHKRFYYANLFKSALIALIILAVSLAIGVIGYHYFYQISWVDSLLNASMILTGMGPVDKAESDGAKIFSSIYALYSGVAFLTSVAVIFAPIVTRFLHKLHANIEE
jgi:hypothetical protein